MKNLFLCLRLCLIVIFRCLCATRRPLLNRPVPFSSLSASGRPNVVESNPDDPTYNVSSELTLEVSRDDDNTLITCAVDHPSLEPGDKRSEQSLRVLCESTGKWGRRRRRRGHRGCWGKRGKGGQRTDGCEREMQSENCFVFYFCPALLLY